VRRSAEEAAVASAGAFSTNAAQQKRPFPTLTAMVVGGMVGAGVFPLPRNVAQATGVYGAVPWAIAGIPMPAFVFRTQAKRRPDLDACVRACTWVVRGFLLSLRILGGCPWWQRVALKR
jgi:hypothetical protein